MLFATGFTQSPVRKILRDEVVKGVENEYRVKIFEKYYLVTNINNVYRDMDPNYDVGIGEFVPPSYFTPKDTPKENMWSGVEKINELTDFYLGEYIAKAKTTLEDENTIDFGLLSDMEGNIKEVEFIFPANLIIPIEVIDQFEQDIINTFQVHFQINKVNRNALYMNAPGIVYLDPIREKRAAKK